MTRRSAPLGAALLALLALIVAACGGTASPSPSSPVATATPSPTAAPTESGSDEPDPSGSAVDLSGTADALAALDSYVVTMEVSGLVPAASAGQSVTMTSMVVQGDEPAAKFTISGAAGAPAGGLNIIVVGDEAWIDPGTGAYIKSPGGAADFESMFLALSPAVLVAEFSGAQAGILKVGDEDRNGVPTEHFRLDASESPEAALAAGIGDGIFELWVARDGGYLVAMRFDGTYDVNGTATAVAMSIDVSDINNPANVIDVPG